MVFQSARRVVAYHETQGLIEPNRGTNGYREYTDDAVLAVTQIRKLLEAGLSTQAIRFILPCATGTAPEIESCPETLEAHRARLPVIRSCLLWRRGTIRLCRRVASVRSARSALRRTGCHVWAPAQDDDRLTHTG